MHAANSILVPSEITEDAELMLANETYDRASFKRSSVHRLVQTYCGKNRVKKDTTTLLWCIVISLIDEVVHQATTYGNEDKKNIRVKNENIVSINPP